MTTEEKLQHFLSFCMEDSRARSQKMLDDYMDALEKTLDEHKKEAVHRADMQLQIEKDRIKRDINKQLAVEELKIRRELSQKHEELKDMLFVELRNELAAFMETNEYQLLLERQVKHAKELAGEEELLIYIDPVDADKIPRLSMHNSVTIKPSEYSFGGGTRAVIPSKNILIDNSFDTKVEEAKHHFTFHLEEKGDKSNG